MTAGLPTGIHLDNHHGSPFTVVARSISKVYRGPAGDVKALDGIDLELSPRTLTMVLGPSGSGKSTLLQLLGGLDSVSTGKLVVSGTDLTGANGKQLAEFRRRTISFVFQTFNLFPGLTALENVELGATLSGRPTPKAAAQEALTAVRMEQRARHFPAQLSGGEQQRVSVARALASGNQLILADEPTGELDAENGRVILRLLRAAVEIGHTVMVVTHNRDMAPAADRVLHMAGGRIVSDDSPPDGPQPVDSLRW